MNRNKKTKNVKVNEAINHMGFTNNVDILSKEDNKANQNSSNFMSNAKN